MKTRLYYQSPKLLGSSAPITNNTASLENLGEIIRKISKIWDGRQKVKSPIVWVFPDI